MKQTAMFIATVLAVVVTAVHGNIHFETDVNQETHCGGSIVTDTGSLTFPEVGQETKPTEVCIWTLHLQTRSTFRLNFTTFDIIGDSEDCSNGAVRLYSLTNLIPADRAESYTFCNNQPPTDSYFFLSENLITVTFRSDYDSSEAGAGFTLNWEGIAVQPIPKSHESSHTGAASGIIRHPIDGEYVPNQVDTWLIKAGDLRPDLTLHFSFSYVSVESCSRTPVEDCLCDALIVYEIASTGILQEQIRLCDNVSDTEISNLQANFILGFFADHVEEVGAGQGFELMYRPENLPTTPPTTPQPPSTNETTACGGVVEGVTGLIEYKANENYENLERCVWTVRTPTRTGIRFHLTQAGLEENEDWISIQTLDASGIRDSAFLTGSEQTSVNLSGTVAIVTFHSDRNFAYTGFSLSFEAEDELDNSLSYYYDYNNNDYEDDRSLKYPTSGVYNDLEFSTFVIARPTEIGSHPPQPLRVHLSITSLDLEEESTSGCKDWIHIYAIESYRESSLRQITPPAGFCRYSDISDIVFQYDTIVIVLSTDEENGEAGFELEWEIIR